jgi:hypothetical protein
MSSMKSVLSVSAVGLCLSLASSAQSASPAPTQALGQVWTNLGELRAPTKGEHVLTGKALAIHGLETVRAELAPYAFQESVALPAPHSLQVTNKGDLLPVVFSGHHLTAGAAEGGATTILYAPSESDDPAYRAAIAAAAGGATVDYFDARVATPDVATLSQYDAVHTWANFAYANNVLFGDNLAAYNDAGGTVVLGVFCTYTSGNFLSGAIMTAGYCPVDSPSGTNHFTPSTYSGGGTTCIYDNVSTLTSTYRDFLVTQGSGVSDGAYADAEICHAYRGTSAPGQGDVVYSNGSGASALGGSGQWANAVANSCVCSVSGGGGPGKLLYAPSEADDPAYRAAISAAAGGATVDYFDASFSTPRAILLNDYAGAHTWANFAYHNNVKMGDQLAKMADAGRHVALGAFCTYTSGNFLSGKIMTAGYNPVFSPSGTNHFSDAVDTGPFGSCLGTGVSSFGAFYRDVLAVQGGGVVDSTYDSDGEISLAFRPAGGAGNVVTVNGSGGSPVLSGVAGDIAVAVGNALSCIPVSLTLPACQVRVGVLGTNPVGCACASMPISGQTLSLAVDSTPTVGTSTTATFAAVGLGGATSGVAAFGYELLILPPFVVMTGLGTHELPIPSSAALVGATFAMQGGRIEAGPGAIVLTNAVDVTIGM